MYRLYIANKNYSSWSLRPWLLMRELDIPFEECLIQYAEGSSWSVFRQYSPGGTVPSLHDGKIVVWDSLPIVEYLAERHKGVWPEEAVRRAWSRCAAAEMHSGFRTLRNVCSNSCGVRVKLNEVSPSLTSEIRRLNELWNGGLEQFGGPFLAGDRFSAVDAYYAPVCFRFQTYGLKAEGRAEAWMSRVLSLPSTKSWYAAALAEPWREPQHEAEILQHGQIVADFRA